jgi:hypothetical protein
MRHALLLAVPLLFATPLSQAELVKVFENIRGTEVYIDTSTMGGGGRFRKVWEIQTYRTPSPQGMLSMKIHKEYDCKDESARMLGYVVFKGKKIGLPMIGAGLAGGDWDHIKYLIQKELRDCQVTIVIYKKL